MRSAQHAGERRSRALCTPRQGSTTLIYGISFSAKLQEDVDQTRSEEKGSFKEYYC